MKTKLKSGAIPWDNFRREQLKNPKSAKIAVKVALEEFEKDNDVETLLDTLRLVAQAQGGLAKLARKAAVTRPALHQALSPKGNPRLRTFQNVLGGLGLRMSVRPLKSLSSLLVPREIP
jgi:probable addiction module antidote protein